MKRNIKRLVRYSVATILTVATLSGTAVADDNKVKLGVLIPLTGSLGQFGEIQAKSIRLAIDQVNGAGGTKCGKLEPIVSNSETDSVVVKSKATRMINSDGVVAILGPTSGPLIANTSLAKRTQTVFMSPDAGSIKLNKLGGDYVYRTVASDLGDGDAAGRWLKEKNYDKIAFMIQNDSSTISVAHAARVSVKNSGISLTDHIIYNPGQSSYQAELTKVLAHDPDAIYLAGGQQAGVTVVKQAYANGYRGDWLFSADLAVPDVFDSIGSNILNGRAYVEVSHPNKSWSEYKAFEKLYTRKYGVKPGQFAANAFDMVNLVALALEQSDNCTGKGINSNLRQISDKGKSVSTFAAGKAAIDNGKDIDYQGASGPLKFGKNGTPRGSYVILKAVDGAWEQEKFYPAASFNK